MNIQIKFNKSKIILGVLFSIVMLSISITFLSTPETFLLNVYITPTKIRIIGTVGVIYFSSLMYSFINMLNRTHAIMITNEFLIDNSRYESLGELNWKEITRIQRLKKSNIEIYLDPDYLKSKNIGFLKTHLRFMHNWRYKNSIVLSSSILECSVQELFEAITNAYEANKIH